MASCSGGDSFDPEAESALSARIAVAIHCSMKTTTLPPLRVAPELRRAIEAVLEEGETLSAFMLGAVAKQAEVRREQLEFVNKALARSRAAERTGDHVRGEVVFKRLERVLARAKRKAGRR